MVRAADPAMVEPVSEALSSEQMPALIDTHCHLDLAAFDGDRDAVLAATSQAGVEAIVVPATQASGWASLFALCARCAGGGSGEGDDSGGDDPCDDCGDLPAALVDPANSVRKGNAFWPRLHPALGLHPVFLDQHQDQDLALLERALVEMPGLVAVGEIGLDFQLRELNRDRQLALCEAQLELARKAGLPVLLHVRKAHEEMLRLLEHKAVKGGIVHAFNGSLQQAARYQALGFKLGFGGMLTYERSRLLRGLAAELPLEALVLETDAPDMTVASHRYQRNSPAYLPEVLGALAEIRQESAAALAAATSANAQAVLRLA